MDRLLNCQCADGFAKQDVQFVSMSSIFASTILCQLEFVSPQLLMLDFGSIFRNLEIWRLVTNFCFFGGFSMNFCFSMFFLVRYGRELEAKRFEGRAGDMLWMMLITRPRLPTSGQGGLLARPPWHAA